MVLQTRELILTGAVVFLMSYVFLNTFNPAFVQSKKDDCKCAASVPKTLMFSAIPFIIFIVIYHYIYLGFEKRNVN